MTENFPQTKVRYQTIAPGSSKSTRQNKWGEKTPPHLHMSFANYKKSKRKRNSYKKPEK